MPLSIGKFHDAFVSYRFRAEKQGRLKSITLYFVFKSKGYYSGDGGKVLLELREDDGSNKHFPVDRAICSATVDKIVQKTKNKYSFASIDLGEKAYLNKGSIYHIVLSNIADDPLNNWVSVNNIYNSQRKQNMQPRSADDDLAVLLKFKNENWQINYGFTPIFSVEYSNGFSYGQGYIDAWISDTATISETQHVGQIIINTGHDYTAKSVSIRLRKKTNSGSLMIHLLDANEQKIGYAVLPSHHISANYDWVNACFKEQILLKATQRYTLVLKALNGGIFSIYPIQKGVSHGFKNSTFSDGYGILSHDNGKTWKGFRDSKEADLQFYFNDADACPPFLFSP